MSSTKSCNLAAGGSKKRRALCTLPQVHFWPLYVQALRAMHALCASFSSKQIATAWKHTSTTATSSPSITMTDQTFGVGEQPVQAINTVVTSTGAAYAGDATQQNSARFTRAERRAYAKEKRVAQQANKPHKKGHKKQLHSTAGPSVGNVEDVITYLLTIRGMQGGRNMDETLNRVAKNLGQHIANVSSKNAQPSAKKPEKMQKRKELRAEKRKLKLAQAESAKREEGSIKAGLEPVPEPQPQPQPGQQQQPLPEFDEIVFDHL
ncbi:hypothetical protein CC78DRAFT_619554 [Lojkania enalia]|uniref:Uncharacterized protein n=1 Tax=Lojkania enalia TaxID=147567 RepID=A0A9P4MXG6_9PLEO|nr:hypothetical protein CC78DRAFT_619554 [Didymosphaeria enalia]